jgi:hypothetical protein
MTELTPEQIAGQDRLKEVARYFAAQHGLRPDSIEWIEPFDGWRLTVTAPEHSVTMLFSLDEMEDFATDGDGAKGSKRKIRDAFAGLTM